MKDRQIQTLTASSFAAPFKVQGCIIPLWRALIPPIWSQKPKDMAALLVYDYAFMNDPYFASESKSMSE